MDWFLHRDLVIPGPTTVPEPPEGAVFAALAWVVARNPIARLFELARSAHTEPQKDAFYDSALTMLARKPLGPIQFDPAAVREALLAGRDVNEPETAGLQPQAAYTHLIVATEMGFDEVGADTLAEALATIRLYPGLSGDDLRQAVQRLENSDDGAKFASAPTHNDPMGTLKRSSIEQLRRARTVLYGLSGFGAMYFMHALLMPETPGLTALRARIDKLGVGTLLMIMCTGMNRTHDAAANLISCLDPWLDAIYDHLLDQVTNGPPLLHGPDSKETADKYMESWIAAIKNLGSTVKTDGNADKNIGHQGPAKSTLGNPSAPAQGG
ncbi:hypothetical protein [Nonomuraea glycinis]|uniref:hypothetical protein n=1 Tax=Nonomuraea glycinis TaxID=2047744 RepID=UPI0033A5E054